MRYVILGFAFVSLSFLFPTYLLGLSLQPEEAPGFGFYSGFGFLEGLFSFNPFGSWSWLT